MSVRYVVKWGDTLSGIASRHGLKSYREIYDHPDNAEFKAKRPDPNKIFVGDVLFVPDPKKEVNFSLPPPPVVAQANTYWCWAGALQSWLEVSPREQFDQHELMEKFKSWTNPQNGGLLPPGWGAVAREFTMDAKMFSLVGGFDSPTSLTPEFLEDKLKNKGFVLFVYNLSPGGPSHANVIYGVQTRNGVVSVKAMDPQGSGELTTRPLSHYTRRDALGVMWAK